MSKITLIAAAAAGYVLGSRAGRGHYEIIKEQVKDQVGDSSGQNGDGQSSGGRHSTDQVQPPTSQYPPSGGGDGTAPS